MHNSTAEGITFSGKETAGGSRSGEAHVIAVRAEGARLFEKAKSLRQKDRAEGLI